MPVYGPLAGAVYGNRASGVLRAILRHRGTGACRSATGLLATAGLPALWVPAPDGFLQVDEIPLLGTGKLDLMRLKELALAKSATTRRPEEELAT